MIDRKEAQRLVRVNGAPHYHSGMPAILSALALSEIADQLKRIADHLDKS